jgi:hypothetical protein
LVEVCSTAARFLRAAWFGCMKWKKREPVAPACGLRAGNRRRTGTRTLMPFAGEVGHPCLSRFVACNSAAGSQFPIIESHRCVHAALERSRAHCKRVRYSAVPAANL